MSEPPLGKFPLELFGFPYTNLSATAQATRQQQHCPFLGGECKKPRKSEPHIKMGLCSVGYSASFYEGINPIIICPHRFELEPLQVALKERFFPNPTSTVSWLSEVSLGPTIGSVDYVAVLHDNDTLHDFMGVELQAAGTTGSPWPAVQDFQHYGYFPQASYNFGINWANEFAKTMMQQAYKKGLLLESWGKKLVFVMQDVGLQYLQTYYDTSDLRPFRMDDALHFFVLSVQWENNQQRWVQSLATHISTDTRGIQRILGGLHQDDYPTQQAFIETLRNKLK